MNIELKRGYSAGMFGSVTYERQAQKTQKQGLLPLQTKDEESEQVKELKEKLRGVTVTISSESLALFERLIEEKRGRLAGQEPESSGTHEERVLDREDPFAPQEEPEMQYIVFTKALSEMGFYNEMSDEDVLKTENLLADITHTMNWLCGNFQCASLDGEKVSVSSYAAQMELESSTAALRQFGEKCLPQEMRTQFERLTEQYHTYNAKKLEGYRSDEERINESTAKLLDRTVSSQERVRSVTESDQVRWIAGKVVTTKADEERAAAEWRECFRRFGNAENDGSRLAEYMNDRLLRYASGGSNDQKLLAYLEEWNRPIVENAKDYWNALFRI